MQTLEVLNGNIVDIPTLKIERNFKLKLQKLRTRDNRWYAGRATGSPAVVENSNLTYQKNIVVQL